MIHPDINAGILQAQYNACNRYEEDIIGLGRTPATATAGQLKVDENMSYAVEVWTDEVRNQKKVMLSNGTQAEYQRIIRGCALFIAYAIVGTVLTILAMTSTIALSSFGIGLGLITIFAIIFTIRDALRDRGVPASSRDEQILLCDALGREAVARAQQEFVQGPQQLADDQDDADKKLRYAAERAVYEQWKKGQPEKLATAIARRHQNKLEDEDCKAYQQAITDKMNNPDPVIDPVVDDADALQDKHDDSPEKVDPVDDSDKSKETEQQEEPIADKNEKQEIVNNDGITVTPEPVLEDPKASDKPENSLGVPSQPVPENVSPYASLLRGPPGTLTKYIQNALQMKIPIRQIRLGQPPTPQKPIRTTAT